MTSEEKNKTGSDVTDVTSGTLGDTIVAWLEKCAAQSIQPRVTATANSVTLRAGPHATTLQVTPETMKAALAEYKSDARWNVAGVKHAGYTDAIYRLNAATPGYISTGKPRTTGTAQTEGNTQTKVLGNVAKAEQAVKKAQDKLDSAHATVRTAEQAVITAEQALEDAKKTQEVKAFEDAKKIEEQKAKKIEDAKKNRAALEAKIKKMREEAAKLEALLAA
jgi:hypothetical protein